MTKTKSELSRREFLASSAVALGAAGLSLTGPGAIFGQETPVKKQKVALVGTGVRGSSLWGRELIRNYADVLEIVGLCDINPIRLEYAKNYMEATCPAFTDFGRMIQDTRPDTVIVTTMDNYHAKYICLAMESGCRPVTEKPMCTDEKMV